jgi:predicted nuclease of restriction endonuclease-like RecB superfamily
LEIVGFWTPEYLQAKLETLRVFSDERILLAVARPAREAFPDLPPTAIPFRTSLPVKEVLERLETHGGT